MSDRHVAQDEGVRVFSLKSKLVATTSHYIFSNYHIGK